MSNNRIRQKCAPFYIKHRPNVGDYGVYDSKTNELLRNGKTMHDVKLIMANLEANLPSTEVGFGQWGVPRFLLRTA